MGPAALGLLGAAIPAISSAFGQERANRQNERLAREAMAFEQQSADKAMAFSERMRDTAWQAGVRDMRMAGLNPMLAFSQGPASSPGGTSAGGQAARVEDVIGPAVSSAQHARRMQADLRSIDAGIARTKAEEDSVRQGIRESEARVANLGLESQERMLRMSSARAASTRAQIFQRPLDIGLNLTRKLFDPQNARIMSFELSRAGQRLRGAGGAALDRASEFLRNAVQNFNSRRRN